MLIKSLAWLVTTLRERSQLDSEKFDSPVPLGVSGIVSVRAHFSSWDEAHLAYTNLEGKRYGNPQPVWLRFPDPMHSTIIILSEQYTAQKAQWGALLNSTTDRKACMLNVHNVGNIVCIRLAGSAKEAMGAVKVRVENLARGEMIEGWHRSLVFSNNQFFRRVFVEAGAYVRADWRRQSLKVYGAARAADRARDLIKTELERLASLDYTVTLMRHSVGFFVREGIPQLKETLGENNARFVTSSRKITVTGGEEARHALDGLITHSLKGNPALLYTSQGEQTCPICYDNVSSSQQLGCGHVYCVACLRHFLSSALDSDQLPLTCLGDGARCRVPFLFPPSSSSFLLRLSIDYLKLRLIRTCRNTPTSSNAARRQTAHNYIVLSIQDLTRSRFSVPLVPPLSAARVTRMCMKDSPALRAGYTETLQNGTV
ncbi:hypothetical protein PAXRUDRAFT_398063 [Paxillus rubicundulus Ve08.2h10]|uniref:RING-type domain-containing protein n=1 Tax=Paxillus rubicundulus Ve08.2h10 TaxID=930991 RepID=A0A0D0CP96_9AGAM|nr:hypothetical protein PAXRUDRAFT_398063 [Paxillus rubicundulus Ve08.2h10]